MSYTNREGRQELLDELARAADELAVALAALGEAYEQLDEQSGDRLEDVLFRPVQQAYGRAKRTHAEFAARHGMPERPLAAGSAGPASGARGHIDHAVEAIRRADDILAELQDTMLPVEIGDAEVRAGLSDVREQIGALPGRARELIRTLGR
jgi:hypothetical protein